MRFTQIFHQKCRAVRTVLITSVAGKSYYYKLYPSYRHSLSYKTNHGPENNYFAARPNPDAGIGHQMANWIAGYWYAQLFDLKFAHIPFSSSKWEHFLGLGEGEVRMDDLIHRQHYKKVRLPLFHASNAREMADIQRIIDSYSDQKVVFLCEQDQFYKEQYGLMDLLKQKFNAASARREDHLVYNPTEFNIAVHVRRGDIVVGQANGDPELTKRWQNNNYFSKVLHKVLMLPLIPKDRPIAIYLFSQGKESDFPEFSDFKNLHFCLDMSAMDSFLHMVRADVLITSKSSFSYKPALLNDGIKVCPQNFWHGYPQTPDWIMVDDDGELLS